MTAPRDKQERDERLDRIVATAERDPGAWRYCAMTPVEIVVRGKVDGTYDEFETFVEVCEWLGIESRWEDRFIATGELHDLHQIVADIKATPYAPAPKE